MMTARWRPLSRRTTDPASEEEALFEGVPAHLTEPLLNWIVSLFNDWHEADDFIPSERRAGRIAARVRLDLRSVRKEDAKSRYGDWCASLALVHLAGESDETVLLDVVDATLAEGVGKKDASALEDLLREGGSAWRVADGLASLERRVDMTTVEAFRAAATGSPAPHLAAAWAAVYGRHPQPSRAYSEAIKAVEAACIPVVLPNDPKATLGKVIGQLNSHAQGWRLAIRVPGGPADVSALLAMLRLLWEGQTDRHGSLAPATVVGPDAAEAAVHLAIALVHWFRAGTVRPISTS